MKNSAFLDRHHKSHLIENKWLVITFFKTLQFSGAWYKQHMGWKLKIMDIAGLEMDEELYSMQYKFS